MIGKGKKKNWLAYCRGIPADDEQKLGDLKTATVVLATQILVQHSHITLLPLPNYSPHSPEWLLFLFYVRSKKKCKQSPLLCILTS